MPDRRTVLASLAAAIATILAGCTSADNGDAEPPYTTTETKPTSTTSTSTTVPTTTRTDTTRDRAEDETRFDRVVVENRTGDTHTVSVTVERDGETLHEETYRAPPNTGLRVQQQFDWGTHSVAASVGDGDELAHEWEHGSCASTPHPNGNQNLGVVVEGGDWSFVKNGCDYLKLGETYVDGYEPAADHEGESTTAA